MSSDFSATKLADETIALLIQHQPNLIKEQYPSTDLAQDLATFISTLRDQLIDMYNLKPPI